MKQYSLDTGKKYIKDIFDKDAFYNIPEYQRPFVWGDDEISILLDDLTKAMDSDKDKEYFLGCMIWNTKTQKNGSVDYIYQDILDGQQRFITLYLLHGVLRDLSKDKKLRKKVNDRLRQEEDEFEGIPARNRIEFIVRDDQDFLNSYLLENGATLKTEELRNIANSKDQSTSVRRMAKAMITMHKWWKIKAKEVEFIQEYLKDFLKFLSSNVLTLYLATPDNLDDAYNLFTVLNSRGVQLQIGDILRAQNLRQIDDNLVRKKLATKWTQYENTIDSPYKKFDDFLWDMVFIKMKYRSDENKSLSKAFDFMYGRGLIEKGEGTFEFLGKYVEHFNALTNASISTEETQCFFQNLNFLLTSVFGNQYMAPLMHYREKFGEYRIIEFAIKIDNLLSAAWLMGKRVSQSRIFIILRKMDEISKDIVDKESLETAADRMIEHEVLKYEYVDANASTFLDINELYKMFEIERWGSFAGTRINKTRYLLLKLDILTGNLNAQLQFNRLNSSVEHLMPRKIEGTEWRIDKSQHPEWLHKLGNLVLIDRKKNASISNSIYNVKKERYKTAIENRPNTNYVFMHYGVWNIDTIQNNHDRSIKMLRRYYEGNNLKTLLSIKNALRDERLRVYN